MGYYIETPLSHGKATQITDGKALLPGSSRDFVPPYEAEIIPSPPAWQDIPEGKALVIVVDNVIFEAAAVAYSEPEHRVFTDPGDRRLRTWVLMDKGAAQAASGAPG